MKLVDEYIGYLSAVRRYSPRTLDIYRRALVDFASFVCGEDCSDDTLVESIKVQLIRSWEVEMLDRKEFSERTVNLQLSVLSGFAGYLIRKGLLGSNPVKLVKRPKQSSRLPVFYKKDDMLRYLERTRPYGDGTVLGLYPDCHPGILETDKHLREIYEQCLRRNIISILYSTGIRRAELISLKIGSFDSRRKVLRVVGKGNKLREIPIVSLQCEEIMLYLKAVEDMICAGRTTEDPLFVTAAGNPLYPAYVDRAVKVELETEPGISCRKSPHVLRHTIATELLDEGADLNSIKEFLGHSSLAATQVYTHNSISKLKTVYQNAHPRAKKK